MTAEELRRLAEIAGLKLSAVGELLQSGSRFYRPNNEGKYYTNPIIPVYDWQPHLRIEQAMMVAEAFKRFEIKKHDYAIAKTHVYDVVLFDGDKFLGVRGFNGILALAICRAALAAAKEV